MRTCEEYRELISLTIDNEIAPEEMVELQRHLMECDECRLVYDAFAGISESLSDELVQPPNSFTEGVMFKIGLERPSRKKHSVWGRFAAIAACFVILAAAASKIGVDRWKSNSTTDDLSPQAAYNMTDTVPNKPESNNETQLFDIPSDDSQPAPDGKNNNADTPTAPTPEPPLPPASDEETTVGEPADPLPEDVPAESNGDNDASNSAEDEMAILMSLTEAEIYTGGPSDTGSVTPDVSTTNSDALAALANLLSFSKLSEEDAPDDDPLFTIIGRSSEDEEIKISIWLSDGDLIIQLGEDSPVYIANGALIDLLDFIKNA